MSFENDLNHALRAATGRARTRVDNARERGDSLEVAEAEIKLLRIQVETLTRLVVELATLEVVGGAPPAQITKRMIELAGPIVDFDAEDVEADAVATQTAYRGVVAGAGSKLCSRCGAMLDEDGPEMTQSTGRVCTSCFARGE
jgi:predicted component of type VI protein secretion system